MESRWAKLLPELLESISDRLPLHDFFRFRGVCMHWRSSPSGRAAITKFPKDGLWLLFYDFETNINDDGEKCYLYTKSHPDCCTIRLPHLRGATVVHSKFGWLLAHRNDQFFFYQPLSFIKIDLPKHPITSDQVYAFTTLPTNPHCTVFIVSRWKDDALEASSCTVGDAKWTTQSIDVNRNQIGTMTSLMCLCNCTARVCDCGHRFEIHIRDESRRLIYICKQGSVDYRFAGEASVGRFTLFKETNERHGKDWMRRFREKGLLISSCAVSAINKNPSADEPYGLRPWTELVGDDGEEEEKFSIVRSAWIEPIYATMEMK